MLNWAATVEGNSWNWAGRLRSRVLAQSRALRLAQFRLSDGRSSRTMRSVSRCVRRVMT